MTRHGLCTVGSAWWSMNYVTPQCALSHDDVPWCWHCVWRLPRSFMSVAVLPHANLPPSAAGQWSEIHDCSVIDVTALLNRTAKMRITFCPQSWWRRVVTIQHHWRHAEDKVKGERPLYQRLRHVQVGLCKKGKTNTKGKWKIDIKARN